jgi:hypothetical protein
VHAAVQCPVPWRVEVVDTHGDIIARDERSGLARQVA